MKVVHCDSYAFQRQLMDPSEVNKLEQAIEVHGYRGASKSKHNGVVNIKPEDKELWKSLTKFKLLNKDVMKGQHIVDVKVVAHVPNGNRIVGIIYRFDGIETLYLLGFSKKDFGNLVYGINKTDALHSFGRDTHRLTSLTRFVCIA
jgi:hypothetical protein